MLSLLTVLGLKDKNILRMAFSNAVSTEKQIPIHFSSVIGEGWKGVKDQTAAEWHKDSIV